MIFSIRKQLIYPFEECYRKGKSNFCGKKFFVSYGISKFLSFRKPSATIFAEIINETWTIPLLEVFFLSRRVFYRTWQKSTILNMPLCSISGQVGCFGKLRSKELYGGMLFNY